MTTTRRLAFLRSLLLAALVVAASGCAGQTEPRSGAHRSARGHGDPELSRVVDEARVALAEHRASLVDLAAEGPLERELEARIATLDEADRPRGELVRELYRERRFAPLILREGRWTDHADALTRAFDDAPHHALRGSYPARARFIDTRSELDRLAAELDELLEFRATDEEWSAVQERLADEDFDASHPDAVTHLVERLRSPDPAHNPLPRLAERLRALEQQSAAWRELVVRTEVGLALDAARYAAELRLGYDENTSRLDPWRKVTTRATRERARLRAFFAHLDEDGAERALASLQPPHEQYPLLVAARRRYAELAAAGGWGELSVERYDKLKRDRKHEAVPALKRRLAAEGYYKGNKPDDDTFDKALEDALIAYQRTHQLKDSGEVDKKLVENLNLPVEDRLAKIDVTLQRYRESLVGSFDYFVLVNLPDFYAEVWRGGELRMRFEIVVGKNDQLRDPKTKDLVFDKKGNPVFANRTPMQTSFIERVIYNPYWNIPPRIRAEEGYDAKLAENPFWLEENGFEMVNPDNPKRSWIRQLPGDKNALGRVKFIFPNEWDVYLHDTPQKRLFKNPTRAYSHGCMRVSKPLELAEFLLREDGQWNASKVKNILERKPLKETVFNLRRDVAIHIDYFNTRVDEDGHVHFLSDVYRYDKPKVEARMRELDAQKKSQRAQN